MCTLSIVQFAPSASAYSETPNFDFEIIDPDNPPQYGGTLVVASDYDHHGWNPITDYWSGRGQRDHVLEKMIQSLGGGAYAGQLAESWDNTPDGKVWTFYLRENVFWSDGIKFTADDIVNHWALFNSTGALGGATSFRARKLQTVEKLDEFTVRFTFENIVNSVGLFSAWGSTLILPAHLYPAPMTLEEMRDHPNNLNPVGTGPYLMKEFVPGQYTIFERNPLYWGIKPYLDTIIYKMIYTPEGRIAALQVGEVDYSRARLPISAMQALEATGDFYGEPGIPTYGLRITWNFREEADAKHPWVKSLEVRHALAHAIDRQLIMDTLKGGYAGIMDGPIIYTSQWYNPDVYIPEYDPDKAEQMLDAAGYPRGPDGVRFSFEMPCYDTMLEDAEVIKEMWKDIGVDMSILVVEEAAFYSMYETTPEGLQDYACSLNMMGSSSMPISHAHPNHDIGHENMGFWYNEEALELMDAYLNTANETYMRELTDRVQIIMTAEDPHSLWLYTHAVYNVYRNGYNNFVLPGEESGFMPRIRNFRLVWYQDPDEPEPTPAPTPSPTPGPTPEPGPIDKPDWWDNAPSWVNDKPSWFQIPTPEAPTVNLTTLYAFMAVILIIQLATIYMVTQKQ
jgi:ABC-type transport system substrate-binding protein